FYQSSRQNRFCGSFRENGELESLFFVDARQNLPKMPNARKAACFQKRVINSSASRVPRPDASAPALGESDRSQWLLDNGVFREVDRDGTEASICPFGVRSPGRSGGLEQLPRLFRGGQRASSPPKRFEPPSDGGCGRGEPGVQLVPERL